MKKLLYICLPIIALSLVASDAWSAQATESGKRPGMEQQFGKGGTGRGAPGGMHRGPSIGLRTGKSRGGPSAKLRAGKRGSKLGIPRGRWWNRKDVQEKLKLTDKQVAKLEKISLNGRKNMIKQRAELEIAEIELEPLMEAKKFDRSKVENVLEKVGDIRSKIAKERHKNLLDTREVLTSDQFKELKEMRGKRSRDGKRSGRRGQGQKRPRGQRQAVR